jgi:dTMP kinase
MPPRIARGTFITLEGGDGSGKSTQATALAERLRAEGSVVRLTEEPAGTALGRRIWEAFKQPGDPITPLAELLFFAAARAQHVQEVILPALARGEIVLCDRFADSTLAYQGYGRGLDLDQVRACNEIATGGLTPNLTLLFDVQPEIGLARADSGPTTEQRDAIGKESLAFHQRVRDGYLALAKSEPDRFVVIDATLPQEAVSAAAWDAVRRLLMPSPT